MHKNLKHGITKNKNIPIECGWLSSYPIPSNFYGWMDFSTYQLYCLQRPYYHFHAAPCLSLIPYLSLPYSLFFLTNLSAFLSNSLFLIQSSQLKSLKCSKKTELKEK